MESSAVIEPLQTKVAPVKEKETLRPKTTINLGNIFKPTPAEEAKAEVKQVDNLDKVYSAEDLDRVWKQYADGKKSQVAEYHLLNRRFETRGHELIILLANPIEEPLLQSIRTELVTYLREKLSNSSINVIGQLQLPENRQRVAYTNKEKFDALVAKNPLIGELRDRFSLDSEF